MPIYDYKAFSPDGKTVRGVVESDSPRSARQKLKKQRLIVSDIKEKSAQAGSKGTSLPFMGGSVKFKDITLFTCLLYTSPSPRDRTRSRMPSSA